MHITVEFKKEIAQAMLRALWDGSPLLPSGDHWKLEDLLHVGAATYAFYVYARGSGTDKQHREHVEARAQELARSFQAAALIYARLRGIDELSGTARTVAQKSSREFDELRRRESQASLSAREADLRALDQYYSGVRERAEKNLKQLAAAEATALTRQFTAGQRGEDPTKFDEQFAALSAQRARVAAVVAQSETSERAEKSKLREGWAAEDQAMAKQHADQRLADVQRLEAQVFAATHSAREREIQDVRTRSEQLRAQYQGDAEMHARIAQSEQAQVADIENRYAEQARRRFLSIRGSRQGLMLGAAGYAALQLGEAGMHLGQAYETAARARTGEEGIQGEIGKREAWAGTVSWIPGVGGPLGEMVKQDTGLPGLQRLLEQVKQSDERFNSLAASLRNATEQGERMRDAFYGVSPARRAMIAAEETAVARMRSLAGSEGLAADKRSEYETAKRMGVSGFALEQMKDAAERAASYQSSLEAASGRGGAFAYRLAQRQAGYEMTDFDAAMAARRWASGLQNAPDYGDVEKSRMADLRHEQEVRMRAFAGLGERQEKLAQGRDAWQSQRIQEELDKAAETGMTSAQIGALKRRLEIRAGDVQVGTGRCCGTAPAKQESMDFVFSMAILERTYDARFEPVVMFRINAETGAVEDPTGLKTNYPVL